MKTAIVQNMPKVTILLPCLNEEDGLETAIRTIRNVFEMEHINGEILVVDNGSTDNSATIAKRLGVTYIFEQQRGYGRAYLSGFPHIKGDFIIMGDPDGSYDFNEIPNFLSQLHTHDAVLGSRFMGHIKSGAMPFLHRYVGNPVLRLLLWILHGVNVTEPSTGFIGLRKEALQKLTLREPGMEFSSEMLVQIKKCGLSLKEIPIVYHNRAGVSKLRAWRDGLRHVRYLLKATLPSFAK